MAALLFPLHVRLSTWIMLGVFLYLAVRWRDQRPVLAGLAWLGGFEVVYQLASLTAGRMPSQHWGPFLLIGIGLAAVGKACSQRIWPSGRLLLVATVVLGVWFVTGFHVNGHAMGGFDSTAEVLNETAKVLWAIAYLVPLLADACVRVDAAERDHDSRASARSGASSVARSAAAGRSSVV